MWYLAYIGYFRLRSKVTGQRSRALWVIPGSRGGVQANHHIYEVGVTIAHIDEPDLTDLNIYE